MQCNKGNGTLMLRNLNLNSHYKEAFELISFK